VPVIAGEECCKTAAKCCAMPAKCAETCVTWVEGYEKGLAQAKSENKIAVVDFYRDGCEWCEQMEQKTFKDPAVVKLSKRFVMVKVNGSQDRMACIRHEVRGFPAVVILQADGTEITRIVGYRRAEDFATDLKEVLAKAKTAKKTAAR
jgi:thiol:disulfide interchange protein DsbD